MKEQTLAARNAAIKASQIASMWYDYLWQDYLNEEFKLHTNYNGLILLSIFDAKPTAYRARAVEQFDFEFPAPPKIILPNPPDPWEDSLQEYRKAYLAEKEAWSLYQANYNNLVDAALKDGIKVKRNDHKHAEYEAGKIRVLECK